MKKYLWSIHIALGILGIFAVFITDDQMTGFGILLSAFSLVALVCLALIYINENKST